MCELFVKLSRVSGIIPWGFRLIGGSDLNAPLTVIKINGGSIAEHAGLQADDIITEINGSKVTNLTHSEVQKQILQSGNDLSFAVLRGSHVQPLPLTPVRDLALVTPTEMSYYRAVSTISVESLDSAYDMSSFEIIDHNFDDMPEKHEPSEDEIAQLLLENAEVLEENGKNVIGVNFKRFIPKCEFIKDSAVFQVLQEEQVHKELTEREQLAKCPNKRFSTFLNTPNRPIPKPKPKIKQESPKIQPTDDIQIAAPQCRDVRQEDVCNVKSRDINDDGSDDANRTQNEVQEETEPAAEFETANNLLDNAEDKDLSDFEQGDETVEHNNSIDDEDEQLTEDASPENEATATDYERKSNTNSFDEQLAVIRSTLDNLRQLPLLIESQLSEVQKRIDCLICLKAANINPDEVITTNSEEVGANENEETDNVDRLSEIEEIIETQSASSEENVETTYYDTNTSCNEPDVVEDRYEELDNKPVKINEQDSNILTESVHQQPKKCRDRPVCPLTPLPRPLVLPGGRRWRKPKDAFNEEFIAETLISQAEVLVGSTLGVNFRKYEPPKFDLSNSAVYKMIHDIESNEKGIASRPEIVPAEQDYYQSPINARHFYCATLASQQSNEPSSN